MNEHLSVGLKFGEWFNKLGQESAELMRFTAQFADQDWPMIITISIAVILYGIMGLRNA